MLLILIRSDSGKPFLTTFASRAFNAIAMALIDNVLTVFSAFFNVDILDLHVGFYACAIGKSVARGCVSYTAVTYSILFCAGTGSCRDTTVSDMPQMFFTVVFHSYQETHMLHSYFVPVFEGIFTSQFDGDTTVIEANPGSAFFMSLNCTEGEECTGTVEQWIAVSFPDFSSDHIKWDFLYLVLVIVSSRVITFMALTKLDYQAT